MKKIPTLFRRDPDDRSRLTDEIHPDCLWVFKGEGVPTYKLDGACCMVRAGKFYKRREVKAGKADPEGFEVVQIDNATGKAVGWVLVGDAPEDQWFREAFGDGKWLDGTFELMGPKVQGNPMGLCDHDLYRHGTVGPTEFPCLGLAEIKAAVVALPERFEGIVWHHPDGRMAKIKRRDFRKP